MPKKLDVKKHAGEVIRIKEVRDCLQKVTDEQEDIEGVLIIYSSKDGGLHCIDSELDRKDVVWMLEGVKFIQFHFFLDEELEDEEDEED